MNPGPRDVTVYRTGNGVKGPRPHYFDAPVSVTRHVSKDGPDELIIEFNAGGRISVFTDHPLLWVEPERN